MAMSLQTGEPQEHCAERIKQGEYQPNFGALVLTNAIIKLCSFKSICLFCLYNLQFP